MYTNYKSTVIKAVVGLVLLIVFFTVVTYFFDAKSIIESIGVKNAYILLFFIALLGGVSSFTTGSYLATLFLFVNEGLSVLLLGLAGGLGIFVGDIVFFYLGKYGVTLLKEHDSDLGQKFSDWMNQHSLRSLQIITYLYVGLTPLPNDLITLSLGVSKHSFKKFLIPLFVGSIQLQTIVAYLFSIGLLSQLID